MTTLEKIIMWTCAILVACCTNMYIDLAIALSIKFGKVPTNFIEGLVQCFLAILFIIGLWSIPYLGVKLAKYLFTKIPKP
jgi:hypothetical protein